MSADYKNDFNDEIEIDLKKVYLALKKGIRWLIVTPTILCILAIVYVLFIAKPVYTSDTKILLLNSDSDQSKLSSLAGQFGFSLPSLIVNDNIDYLSTETLPEIISSRELAKSILFTVFNSKEFDEPTSLFNIITKQEEISPTDSNKIIVKTIKRFSKKMLNIKQIRLSSMFLLEVNSPEPHLSEEVLMEVIRKLEKLQVESRRQDLIDEKDFISERLESMKSELFQAETKLKYFREQNLQISLSPSLILQQERLERDIEVQTQIYISLKQQFEQLKIEENKLKPVLKIVDSPNIPVFRSKPKRMITVIILGLIGLIIGSMLAIVKYYKRV